MSDIQLWTVSSKKVYLQPDVDGPIILTLVKVKGSSFLKNGWRRGAGRTWTRPVGCEVDG